MNDLVAVLKSELARHDTGWSIGSFGAIGEFHQDLGETLLVDDSEALTRATLRGAIRIVPQSDMEAVAYESLSPRPHRWSQGIALCLPEAQSSCARRNVLTELGPDIDAIAPSARNDILFDIGLAQPQIDFCIRTGDPDLLAILRSYAGEPTFATHAGHTILSAHPHRVVCSKLGRVEVYQKIGGPDTGGRSPAGPHTHVLPKLLASGRTHSANTPVPDGLVPCAFLYPASPVLAALGEDKDFALEQFEGFQAYLDRYGAEPYVRAKREIWSAVEAGRDPADVAEPDTRLERTAVRNALRQMARIAETRNDAALVRRIADWRSRFDKLDDDAPAEHV